MDCLPEVAARRRELERAAPLRPRGVWRRTTWNGRDVVFLCGTLGAEFDTWQRRLSLLSAADALLSQQLGLDAVEREMDRLETAARAAVEAEGGRLRPRRSPGYGELPIGLSREIVERLEAAKRIGVSVTDANLLVPSKSVTAICEVRSTLCYNTD